MAFDYYVAVIAWHFHISFTVYGFLVTNWDYVTYYSIPHILKHEYPLHSLINNFFNTPVFPVIIQFVFALLRCQSVSFILLSLILP